MHHPQLEQRGSGMHLMANGSQPSYYCPPCLDGGCLHESLHLGHIKKLRSVLADAAGELRAGMHAPALDFQAYPLLFHSSGSRCYDTEACEREKSPKSAEQVTCRRAALAHIHCMCCVHGLLWLVGFHFPC